MLDKDAYVKSNDGGVGRPRRAIVDGRQQCSTCREWKPVDDFYPCKTTYNKLETRCISCTKIRQRNFYNDSIERYLEALCKAHLRVGKTKRATARRKAMHDESQVTKELLIHLWNKQDGRCAITGVPMTTLRGFGHSVLTNLSIDRIDSNIGYVVSNVRLVCKAVNVMKYVLSDSELIQWAALILNGPLANKTPTNQDHSSETAEG